VTDLNGTSGTFSFANTNAVQYLAISSSGSIDETRYGTTLADVVPVPEPTCAALGLLAAAGILLRRRFT
jgi:hypothetical protein